MRTDQEKYCFNCGAVIDSKAEICPKCGVAQPAFSQNQKLNNQWLTVFLFCCILGLFGAHRFYLKRTTSAIFQLITLGGLGIWMLVDLILIIVGEFKDKNGDQIKAMIKS